MIVEEFKIDSTLIRIDDRNIVATEKNKETFDLLVVDLIMKKIKD